MDNLYSVERPLLVKDCKACYKVYRPQNVVNEHAIVSAHACLHTYTQPQSFVSLRGSLISPPPPPRPPSVPPCAPPPSPLPPETLSLNLVPDSSVATSCLDPAFPVPLERGLSLGPRYSAGSWLEVSTSTLLTPTELQGLWLCLPLSAKLRDCRIDEATIASSRGTVMFKHLKWDLVPQTSSKAT